MFNKTKKFYISCIGLILICIMLFACMSGCNGCVGGKMDPDDYAKVTNPVTNRQDVIPTQTATNNEGTSPTEVILVDNPINFEELTALNPDLYAWIRIPNTAIDNPVAQSSNSDQNFYLHHNYLGNYEFAGTIYSQRHNTKYFIDRVTVLYGHNMLNGTMFADLHKFSDEDFFEENDTMYIYIDGHILTYKIFAAYEYDDRHILNSFEFHDDEVYEKYLQDCLSPQYSNSIVREGTTLGVEDKILTLSTCTNYNSNRRFLVQGVLIKDEKTR
ncbi:MAG: class B sortase [Ruminococcus sp.]|nr:class B sortase [Ruminococcus sp.]